MKKQYLFACVLAALTVNVAVAQKKGAQKSSTPKVIYKWTEDGLIHYSHVKPAKVKTFTKLDAKGREIEDFSKDFGEVQEIIVRPSKAQKASADNSGKTSLESESNQRVAAEAAKNMKQKNCETAQKNLNLLKGGEVYERDSQGNMIRLTKEQIDSKLTNVQKDVGYFCSE